MPILASRLTLLAGSPAFVSADSRRISRGGTVAYGQHPDILLRCGPCPSPSHSTTMAAIDLETLDGTAWITINRPERSNAFTPQGYGELRDAVRRAERDPAVDIVVITGVGKSFATGGDLDSLNEVITSDDPLALFVFEDNLPFEAIRNCTKVTIAAVNGVCFGAGLIITGLCDLAVASERATFSIPEGLVGIADPYVCNALFTRISTRQLSYMALTGEPISAAEALQYGIVNRVGADDQLVDMTNELAAAVRKTTPTARRSYKRYIDDLLPRPDTRDRYQAVLGDEGRAALSAFVSRRQRRS
jgi:enoyl-CoA hydratase/carnithine racemase